MKVTFIGDVHGKYEPFKRILNNLDGDVIQLGDLGVGFNDSELPNTFRFIHGNHDNPELCADMPQFLGRYGMLYDKVMFASGAYSIDKHYRTVGVSWWEDEELHIREMYGAIELYEKVKPDIMITHDCPLSVYDRMVSRHITKNSTADFLQALLEIHQPKKWIFGHHHISKGFRVGVTEFTCVGELDTLTIDV